MIPPSPRILPPPSVQKCREGGHKAWLRLLNLWPLLLVPFRETKHGVPGVGLQLDVFDFGLGIFVQMLQLESAICYAIDMGLFHLKRLS